MMSHDQPATTAMIFDFGGVFDPKHESLAGFHDAVRRWGLTPAALYDTLYSGAAWQQARTGVISHTAYLETVMRALEPTTTDVAAFRARLFAGHTLDQQVIALARRLARRYPLALLSNATDELEATLVQHELLPLFQVVINSARVGVAKPDPAAYQLALDGLGVQPAQALFIDDKPRNIVAAEMLGIPAILFVDAAGLERALVERGLLGADHP